jgi:periplasmic protein TonB
MYGELRPRAPFSTHAAALSTTALVLGLVGLGLMAGLAAPVVVRLTQPTILITPPEPKAEAERPPIDPGETIAPLTTTPHELPDDVTWDEVVAPAAPDSSAPALDVGASIAPATAAVVASLAPPRLLAREAPPYPPQAERAGAEGISALELCINAAGRVTSVRLTAGAGHPALDRAALDWARQARFAPAHRAGTPEAVCGYSLDYQWRIERGR